MNYDELLEHIEQWHRTREKNEINEINEISTPIQPQNDQNKEVNSLNSLISYDRKYPTWPCVNCGGSKFRLATGKPPSKAWICEDCVPVEAN